MTGRAAAPAALEGARAELVELCHRLGDPAYDFAILGEGNAGVVVDGTQLVTASGSRLTSIAADEIVALDRAALIAALDAGEVDDASWSRAVASTAIDGTAVPTIEAALHAVASRVTGSPWTAHTHPTSITGLLSSGAAAHFAEHPLFPDQIVVNGPVACFLPYIDPGYPLAWSFREALIAFERDHSRWPRLVLLANHGMVAIGASASDVFEITLMADKAARVYAAASSSGTVVPLTSAAVERIDTRSDEEHRRTVLRRSAGAAS